MSEFHEYVCPTSNFASAETLSFNGLAMSLSDSHLLVSETCYCRLFVVSENSTKDLCRIFSEGICEL